jgi:nicotinamide-nucleotide amidase
MVLVRAGLAAYGKRMFSQDILRLAQQIVATAAERGVMIATAESCTGGLVCAALTAVPGSSAVVDRGFVTYSNAAKQQMLGVPEATLIAHGAVSEPTARAMAEGAAAQSNACVSVSVTGIAGPGGGGPDKPVGLVHFAAVGPGGLVHRMERFGDLGRDAVRMAALRVALEMLADRAAS